MPKVNAYKDGVIERLYKGLQGLIKSGGITVVEGEGKLVGPKTVEVAGQQYTGTNVVLATGSYARSLPGLEIGGRVITSDEALTMSEVPATGRHHRRQRHRRRVRLRLEVVRCRRHDHRGASDARPARGSVAEQAARARVPQAQDQLQDRREVQRRQADRRRRHRLARERRHDRDRSGPRRCRSRPELGRPGLRRSRHHGRPRLGAHQRTSRHQRRRRVRRR